MNNPYKCKRALYQCSYLFSLFFLFSVGCSDDLSEPTDFALVTKGDVGDSGSTGVVMKSDSTLNGEIVLGAAIPNPYTLDTVRKAFTKIFPNGYGQMGPSGFVATDLYIRFLPANDEEYQLLENSGIILTTLPMDRKITQSGSSYFDPSLNPDVNEYTWQYTIMPITKTIPNVRHEILKQLCNIEPTTNGQQGPGGLTNAVLASIEAKAYQMSGQTPPPPISGNPGSEGPPKWQPEGKIEVWDDKVNDYVGAKGAEVVCKGFCYITRGVTDSYGKYVTNSKRGENLNVAYEIQWGRDSWKVQDDNERREAIYDGPELDSPWSVKIKGGKQQTFATVTRALHRMYNEFNYDVSRPTGAKKVKVICFDSSPTGFGAAYFSGNSFLGLDTEAEITIWGRKNNSILLINTSLLFSYITHELGHAIHFRRLATKSVYRNADKIILESWAVLIQNYITELEYKELGSLYGGSFTLVERKLILMQGPITYGPVNPVTNFTVSTYYNRQGWPFLYNTIKPGGDIYLDGLKYSPVLIDLVDSDNQGLYYKACGIIGKWDPLLYKKIPNDDVKGFKLSELEKTLADTRTLDDLRRKVKAIHNNPAENIKIDTLFNKTIHYWNKYKHLVKN